MSVDVVIVNWNSRNQVKECVESLLENWSDEIKTVTVVDNGSTDGSEAGLEKTQYVRLIRAGANLGFGKACNLGAAQGGAEFIVFLNPDAKVFRTSITLPSSFMDRPENSDVGVCGIQLIDQSGQVSRGCARSPSGFQFIAHSIGLDRLVPRIGYFMGEWDHSTSRSVDHVIGAFYFIRRSLFESLGGFDERFFVYLEDLDLSMRVKNEGWRIEYIAGTQAFHAGGGVSDQIKSTRLFYALRSRIIYAYKNLNHLSATLVLLSTLLLEPLSRTTYFLLKGSFASVRETWVAQARLVRWIVEWVLIRTARRKKNGS